MVLTGTLINGALIIVETLLGLLFKTVPENMKDTILKALGLFIIVLGISMGLKGGLSISILISLVLGAVLGEAIDLDRALNILGKKIEEKFSSNQDSKISEAFITATLIFVIGAMGVIGALDSGIKNNHDVLITKSVIDGVTSVILASTLGIGTILSAIPVVLYQGSIALFAMQIDKYIPEKLMTELISTTTAIGGIMIIAIGLNILGIVKVKVVNLLPSLVVSSVIVAAIYYCKTIGLFL